MEESKETPKRIAYKAPGARTLTKNPSEAILSLTSKKLPIERPSTARP